MPDPKSMTVKIQRGREERIWCMGFVVAESAAARKGQVRSRGAVVETLRYYRGAACGKKRG
jgi:hypothetical protein